MSQNKRIFGLDILRTAAIVQIVIGHGNVLITKGWEIPHIDGVDLFFVLSGYLIGRIIIKSFSAQHTTSGITLIDFLQRRWFRTLPNYFLFLGVNVLLIYFGLLKGELNQYSFAFLLFFQNFLVPFDFMFWESWSLSVEEWFYFIFPTLLALISFVHRITFKSKMLTVICFFIVIPLIYRISQADMETTKITWDLFFRKLVVTRLDTIGFGVLAAFLHTYYTNTWRKLSWVSFALGSLLLVLFHLITLDLNALFGKVFYFTFVSIAIALLLPLLTQIRNENIPFKPFEFISKISYSMYLVHIPILQILAKYMEIETALQTVFSYLLYWVLVIIISALIYRLFERPIMNFREIITLRLVKRQPN